jgi:PhnB protein
MAVKPVPDGYHSVTPYLIVRGASQLIDFAKEVFGAEETFRMPRPSGVIMHAEIRIGDSMVMLSDASGAENPPMPAMIHLYIPNVDAVYKRALVAGASSLREPQDQFYGDRSAGVKDSFGNHWWIATHIEDVSPEELQRRTAAQGQPAGN